MATKWNLSRKVQKWGSETIGLALEIYRERRKRTHVFFGTIFAYELYEMEKNFLRQVFNLYTWIYNFVRKKFILISYQLRTIEKACDLFRLTDRDIIQLRKYHGDDEWEKKGVSWMAKNINKDGIWPRTLRRTERKEGHISYQTLIVELEGSDAKWPRCGK